MPIIVMLDKDTWTTSENARVVTVPQRDLDDGNTEKYGESGITVRELIDFLDKSQEKTDEMIEIARKFL